MQKGTVQILHLTGLTMEIMHVSTSCPSGHGSDLRAGPWFCKELAHLERTPPFSVAPHPGMKHHRCFRRDSKSLAALTVRGVTVARTDKGQLCRPEVMMWAALQQ